MSWNVYIIRTKTNTESYDKEAGEDIFDHKGDSESEPCRG